MDAARTIGYLNTYTMTQPTTNKTSATSGESPITQLRRLTPKRPLNFSEAKRLAELQTTRLLELSELRIGRVSESIITNLPRVDVQYRSGLIGSGLTVWDRGAWRIGINADEPRVRQRFTLAHELKHVLDASDEDAIYGHLSEGPARQRHIEAVCDHFAASLLMPRAWVKRLWGQGIQDLPVLSSYFDVSQQAMLIRLQALGLTEPLPRCVRTVVGFGRMAISGSTASIAVATVVPGDPGKPRRRSAVYQRLSGLSFENQAAAPAAA